MLVIIYSMCSYLLGTCMTATLVGKWYGVSLANEHSGNLGARNAGRTLGKMAFVWTAAGDVLKGVIIVMAAHVLGFPDYIAALGLTCGLLGHLYPFWLRFHGGKGVATLLGGLVVLEPLLLIGVLVMIGIGYLLTRSLTLGFVISVLALIAGILIFYPAYSVLLLALAAVLLKHRPNIQERWR